jgi:hypothetical protein
LESTIPCPRAIATKSRAQSNRSDRSTALEKLFDEHRPFQEATLIPLEFVAFTHSGNADAEFHQLLSQPSLTQSIWVPAEHHAGFGEQSARLEAQKALAAAEYRRLIAGMGLTPNL